MYIQTKGNVTSQCFDSSTESQNKKNRLLKLPITCQLSIHYSFTATVRQQGSTSIPVQVWRKTEASGAFLQA